MRPEFGYVKKQVLVMKPQPLKANSISTRFERKTAIKSENSMESLIVDDFD